jgi:cyclophilin family peptidyl-prolyl cis-trans isomerase
MKSILWIFGIVIFGFVVMLLVEPKPPKGGLKGNPADQDNTSSSSSSSSTSTASTSTPTEVFKPPMKGAFDVVMTIAGKGDVTIQLYPQAAPKTVAEFKRLVTTGYYNGIKFHRVEPNFVVQAGDPQTRKYTTQQLAAMTPDQIQEARLGTGGSGVYVPFEKNNLQNITGTVAMALNAPKSNSANGQFYINLKSNHFLDGNYCVFGKVISGMNVVDKITLGDEITKMVVKP